MILRLQIVCGSKCMQRHSIYYGTMEVYVDLYSPFNFTSILVAASECRVPGVKRRDGKFAFYVRSARAGAGVWKIADSALAPEKATP